MIDLDIVNDTQEMKAEILRLRDEVTALRARCEALEVELARCQYFEGSGAEDDLAQVLNSRRYKIINRLLSPLDKSKNLS